MNMTERLYRTADRLKGAEFTAAEAVAIINEYGGQTVSSREIIPRLKKVVKLEVNDHSGRACTYTIGA